MAEHNDEIKISVYDRLLRAWENSMELTRDFEMYAKSIDENKKVKQVFEEFAEDEGFHAAKLRELIKEYRANHEDRFI